MFDFREVVCGILIECEFSNGAEGEFGLWPDFCEVEDGVGEGCGLLGGHGLNVDSPGGKVTRGDGGEEVLCCVVGVGRGERLGLGGCECLDALVCFEVNLDVCVAAIGFGEFVRVPGVPVHMSVAVWSPAVREKMHELMD